LLCLGQAIFIVRILSQTVSAVNRILWQFGSGRQDENFLSPFSASSFTIFLGLFYASTVHTAKNLDFFRPSATTISQEHPERKIIFSHRNILVIFPSIRKKQDASDKGDVLLVIIFYKP